MTVDVLMLSMCISCQEEFHLELFCSLESVGVSSSDDNMLEYYLTSCIIQDDDGVYVAGLPWKSAHPTLLTSFAKHIAHQLVK